MKTAFVEATQPSNFNHGKFLVGVFEPDEWARLTTLGMAGVALLDYTGWTREHIYVLDLATGEGAIFKPGGFAKADLNKHKIWVCPMFEPFLTWLYRFIRDNPANWFSVLPSELEIEAEASMYGYRRAGE